MICRNYVRVCQFLHCLPFCGWRRLLQAEDRSPPLSLRILCVFNPQLIIMIITLISLHLNLSLNFRIQGGGAIIHLSHWSRIQGFFSLCFKSFQGILSNNYLFVPVSCQEKLPLLEDFTAQWAKRTTHCRLMTKAHVVIQIIKKINRQQGSK